MDLVIGIAANAPGDVEAGRGLAPGRFGCRFDNVSRPRRRCPGGGVELMKTSNRCRSGPAWLFAGCVVLWCEVVHGQATAPAAGWLTELPTVQEVRKIQGENVDGRGQAAGHVWGAL